MLGGDAGVVAELSQLKKVTLRKRAEANQLATCRQLTNFASKSTFLDIRSGVGCWLELLKSRV